MRICVFFDPDSLQRHAIKTIRVIKTYKAMKIDACGCCFDAQCLMKDGVRFSSKKAQFSTKMPHTNAISSLHCAHKTNDSNHICAQKTAFFQPRLFTAARYKDDRGYKNNEIDKRHMR